MCVRVDIEVVFVSSGIRCRFVSFVSVFSVGEGSGGILVMVISLG